MPHPTTPAARTAQHARLARTFRVQSVHRPLPRGGTFALSYTRTGPQTSTPVVVLPGGPGLASVLPYAGLRRRATAHGMDVIMMEHRGVGLSRLDAQGTDLPASELRIAAVIDDLVAILNAERVERAVVYGSSYGSLLALAFGARHPERVARMILDSAMLGASWGAATSRALHDLYWDAAVPLTHGLAVRIRALADRGVLPVEGMGFVLQLLHEFGGPPTVARFVALLEEGRGRNVARWAQTLGSGELTRVAPFHMEFDLVGEIAFRELNYGGNGGAGPLDQASQFAAQARNFSPFEPPGIELAAALPRFRCPTVVVSGDLDIRTPRSVAEEVVALIPGAQLLAVPDHGHSALDTRPRLALEVMRAVTAAARQSVPDRRGATPELPQPRGGSRGAISRILAARLWAATLPFAR